MNFQIINSGSNGNAVVIEKSILIDCGVSFSKLKDYYEDLKIVFLTHIHGDHFNKKTIKRLAYERPTLRFACCEWLICELVNCGVDKRNIDVLEISNKYQYKDFIVEAVELFHDVPNCGYKLEINNKKVIYATDTNSLNHIKAKDYDLYLVEGNYELEDLMKRIKEKEDKHGYAYENRVLNTHMSKEDTNNWLVEQMNENSQFVYMHEHKEKVGG